MRREDDNFHQIKLFLPVRWVYQLDNLTRQIGGSRHELITNAVREYLDRQPNLKRDVPLTKPKLLPARGRLTE
jgi:metal-responsive CopG/Arc/MetJ family transcriptional regulator